jgi:hypothetical protein
MLHVWFVTSVVGFYAVPFYLRLLFPFQLDMGPYLIKATATKRDKPNDLVSNEKPLFCLRAVTFSFVICWSELCLPVS